GRWNFLQKLLPNPTAVTSQSFFGTAVAIDGNTIVVSSPSHSMDTTNLPGSNLTDAGALFVYTLTGDYWTQTQKLVESDRILGDNLGNSVSICGDNIIAGSWSNDFDANAGARMEAAGAAYIFERRAGKWE